MHIHIDRVEQDVRVISLAKLVKWYGEHERAGLDYSLVFNTIMQSMDLTHACIIGIPDVIEGLWDSAERMAPDESRNITIQDIRNLKRFIVTLENTNILHDQEVLIAQWDDVHAK